MRAIVFLCCVASHAILEGQAHATCQEAAQSAVLTGTVSDASSAALQGVTIDATDTASSRVSTATTDSQGRYMLDLAPGTYAVQFTLSGFVSMTAEVRIAPGDRVALDQALSIAPFSESTIVVTATRTEKPLKDVPATLNVVTQEEIEQKGVRFIGDELASVPGVAVKKNDEGTYTSLIIRGVPSQHQNDTFLALLDGVPFVSPSDEVDLETIPLDIVERVEVVKGPMSALYGRGSISGAVNYLSRAVPLRPTAVIGSSAGHYGHVRPYGSFSVPLAPGKNHLFVSGYAERKDGWRHDTDRRAGNLFAKDHWFISPQTDLVTYGSYHEYRQHIASHLPLRSDGSLVTVTGGDRANYNIEDPFYDKRIVLGSGVLRHVPNDRWNLRTTVHVRDLRGEFRGGFADGFDEAAGTVFWNGFESRGAQRAFFVEPQVTWTGAGMRMVAGGSYERLTGDSEELWTGQYGFVPPDRFFFYTQVRSFRTGAFLNQSSWITDKRLDAAFTANIGGGYAQAEVDMGSRATVTGGVRLDRFDREVRYAEVTTIGGTDPASSQHDADHHASPKVAATVKLTPRISAYGAFGEGFSPAFGPIFAFGNRDVSLRPEVARSVEGGIKGDVADGRVSIGVATYLIERRDLLLLIADGPGVRTANAGKQRARGVEVDSRFALRRGAAGLTGYLRYAYTDSTWRRNRFVIDELTGEEIDLSGRSVAQVPAHQWSLGVTKRWPGQLTTTAWYDYSGDYNVDGLNTFRSGAYGLLNASVHLQPTRVPRVELQLTGTNLTNRRYYFYAGTSRVPTEAFPGLPFQLLATVKVKLR